jgi:hypothetical protein
MASTPHGNASPMANSVLHIIPRNDMQFLHTRLKSLNINSKLMLNYPTPPVFSYTKAFLKNALTSCLKHRRVFFKGGHLFKKDGHLFYYMFMQ